MVATLLNGLVVVDLARAEPGHIAARILAELGAEVVGVGDEPIDRRGRVWDEATSRRVPVAALDRELAHADVVFATPYHEGAPAIARERAPAAVWVDITPFGLDGPRARWKASDLGVMAATGNLWATGDPDRPPVRCAEPISHLHSAPEAAMGALTALALGGPRHVDVSMQEAVLIANVATPARFPQTGFRGQRRGANIGRTREIWPCRDGFVSFGLRGGKARAPSLAAMARLAGLPERDWEMFQHTTATAGELAAIEEHIGAFFASKTMRELYALACEQNLMLAPINSPREIWASEQLAARDFFTRRCFAVIHEGATAVLQRPVPDRTRAWEGTTIVELGSGAAGPIAVRYFAEHGATVIRLESRTRPDFLRVYALGPDNPHGLEGAPMFDGLNCGKLGVTLNLKHPDGVAVARRLIAGADAVAENFAPRAMRAFGLDYETLARDQPDLVMLSACLNGQTGPHRDYPGFGGQGAALAGFNFLTGWPDREPIGPHGTITDSLAPRFSAVALAAALLHRRRTGRGAYIDLAQVEAGLWTLWPWLRAYRDDGAVGARLGNRHPDAIVHGVFPCAGDDRWIAIAAWTPAEWNDLVRVTDLRADASQSEAEKLLGEWTATRQRDDIAEQLQAAGVEAVPVADFGDLHDDPQLAARHHFQPLTHPYLGAGLYERNGFRIDGVPSGYDGPGPTLGEHTDQVLRANGGYDPAEIEALRARGALQ